MKNLISILVLFCFIAIGSSYHCFSQITINFVPSSGTTLTQADVNNTLGDYTSAQLADGFVADIDASVTSIGEYAFDYNNYLLSVIANSVTSIGIFAFRNCYGLTSVSFPVVTSIGQQTFSSCSSLTSVSFPVLTSVGDYVFYFCTGLTSVSIGTDLITPTTIATGIHIFFMAPTTNAYLTLGQYVLPEREGNFWNGFYWKSITLGIEEHINNFIISPNPTPDNITLGFDILEAGNFVITLIDLSGTELMQLHSSFEDARTFSKTFSVKHLPVGVYFLQISHNGNVRTEKIVKE